MLLRQPKLFQIDYLILKVLKFEPYFKRKVENYNIFTVTLFEFEVVVKRVFLQSLKKLTLQLQWSPLNGIPVNGIIRLMGSKFLRYPRP